jgi:hypothetical protein
MNPFIPRTQLGWWAGWLAAGFFGAYTLGTVLAGIGQLSGDIQHVNPWLSIVAVVGLLCIVGASVTAIAALIHKDRSVPVWVGVALGVVALFFLLGELLVPH